MRGFDPEFTDLTDYIIKITERIWERRDIGLIRRWYAPDCVTHTSMGPIRGAEAVVAGTLDTLNAFPDRQLLAEDVIWSGDDTVGFLSSHRVSSPGTHLGAGVFGPPTGRAIHSRALADCACLNNQVVEEWLTRDYAGILVQVGLDPAEFASRLAADDAAIGREPWHLDDARRLRAEGALRPPVHDDHPAARLVRQTLDAIWNRTEIGAVRDVYHPACVVHAPAARLLHGHDRLERWLIGWLSAFPDARLAVEHSIAREDAGLPIRVATRWWLTGTHTGYGAFGPPSGATVLALGITHHHVVDGRIREEWTVVDEVAVRKQIALHAG